MRGLMLLCIMMLAGDAMGFPRGRILSTNDAINRKFLTAAQEGRYAPLDSLFSGRASSVVELGATKPVTFLNDRWYFSRLKNVVADTPVARFQWLADGAGTQLSRIALYEAGYKGAAVVINKIAASAAPVDGFGRVWNLDAPITLSKDKVYLIAHCTDVASDFFGVELGSSDFVDGGGPVLTYDSDINSEPQSLTWIPGGTLVPSGVSFSAWQVVSIYSTPIITAGADYHPFLRDLY